MGFLSRLFAAGKNEGKSVPEHSVIVRFRYGATDLSPLFTLEDALEAAISSSSVGEYDGHEVAMDGSDASLYMYGPNADKLLDVVRPILDSSPFMRGAKVTKRYGPPEEGVREEDVILGS
jgi:hypothetical protein